MDGNSQELSPLESKGFSTSGFPQFLRPSDLAIISPEVAANLGILLVRPCCRPLFGITMELIFHEQQEGHLCAQHCLNSLLQGPYFTAVHLGEIAREIDQSEASLSVQPFSKEQSSSNYDSTGFFSIQVIQRALSNVGVDLTPFDSQCEQAVRAREYPGGEVGFVCNHREHWFAIRKLGQQWFNMNSMLEFPELLSEVHLSLMLAQLKSEGYFIFVAHGVFPESEVDLLLQSMEVEQAVKPRYLKDLEEDSDRQEVFPGSARQEDYEDLELKEAIRLSLAMDSSSGGEAATAPPASGGGAATAPPASGGGAATAPPASGGGAATDPPASGGGAATAPPDSAPPGELDQEELRNRRLLFLEGKSSKPDP